MKTIFSEEFKKLSLSQLIADIETNKFLSGYYMDWIRIFNTILEKTKDDNKEELFTQYQKDLMLFTPMITCGGDFLPPTGNLRSDFLDYYLQRVDQTSNNALRVRYCEAIIEFSKNLRSFVKYHESYLKLAQFFLDNGWTLEALEVLKAGLKNATASKNDAIIDEFVCLHFDFIRHFIKGKENIYRWPLDLVDSLLDTDKKYWARCDVLFLQKVVADGIEYYDTHDVPPGLGKNFSLLDAYHELNERLLKRIGREESRRAGILKKVDSIIAEAEWKKENYPSGHLVAATFYERVYKILEQLGGCKERMEQAKLKIIEYQKYGEEHEMATISVDDSGEIGKYIQEHVNSFIKMVEGRELKEIFHVLAGTPLPSFDEYLSSTKDNKSVLSEIMPTQVIKDGLIRGIDPKDFDADRSFIMEFKINLEIVKEILEIFEAKEAAAYFDVLIEFFNQQSNLSERAKPFIKHAIKRYQEGDFVSAIHVLIPQVEATIRNLLEMFGKPIFKEKGSGEQQYDTMKHVVDEIDACNVLEKDLVKAISLLLIDVKYENLRNDIAHGFIEISNITKDSFILVLFLIMKLCRSKVEREKKDA